MRIHLLRHGESQANVAGIVSDDPRKPWPLTDRGRQQARQAGMALAPIAFTHVYVSRHLRTRQTAETVQAVWRERGLATADLALHADPRLDERRSGLDGRPVEDFNGLVRPDPVRIRPPGGETFLEQMQRLADFLDDMARQHPDATLLAVSHENPIQAARAAAGMAPLKSIQNSVGNCEWIVLDW